jgi:hypothetical protein
MPRRFIPAILCLILVLFSGFAGCASAPVTSSPATPAVTALPGTTTAAAHTSIAEQLASVKSDNPVWKSAYHMFSAMKSTEYVHPPYTVDEPNGIYKFDCLGFADHALMDADMAAYTAIGKGANPSIESYAAYFNRLSTATPDTAGWTKVVHPIDLLPGDICLWLKPGTLDTGHMWIIAGTPSANPKRSNEVLVRILDSTGTPHSDDSRTGAADRTGLGSGILGMMVDTDGNPAGLYWEGGASTGAGEKDTTIVCGRLDK